MRRKLHGCCELRRSGIFGRIHIAYGSGDEGTALGAACAYSYQAGQISMPGQMPFFGPAPQLDTVRKLVIQHHLRMQQFPSEAAMLEAAAGDIADDRIVALCIGRMEYGARALGNRSLLALHRTPATRIASISRSKRGKTTVLLPPP
jgi:carbamoyltransferase